MTLTALVEQCPGCGCWCYVTWPKRHPCPGPAGPAGLAGSEAKVLVNEGVAVGRTQEGGNHGKP